MLPKRRPPSRQRAGLRPSAPPSTCLSAARDDDEVVRGEKEGRSSAATAAGGATLRCYPCLRSSPLVWWSGLRQLSPATLANSTCQHCQHGHVGWTALPQPTRPTRSIRAPRRSSHCAAAAGPAAAAAAAAALAAALSAAIAFSPSSERCIFSPLRMDWGFSEDARSSPARLGLAAGVGRGRVNPGGRHERSVHKVHHFTHSRTPCTRRSPR